MVTLYVIVDRATNQYVWSSVRGLTFTAQFDCAQKLTRTQAERIQREHYYRDLALVAV